MKTIRAVERVLQILNAFRKERKPLNLTVQTIDDHRQLLLCPYIEVDIYTLPLQNPQKQ
jgi:hypothetical protein